MRATLAIAAVGLLGFTAYGQEPAPVSPEHSTGKFEAVAYLYPGAGHPDSPKKQPGGSPLPH